MYFRKQFSQKPMSYSSLTINSDLRWGVWSIKKTKQTIVFSQRSIYNVHGQRPSLYLQIYMLLCPFVCIYQVKWKVCFVLFIVPYCVRSTIIFLLESREYFPLCRKNCHSTPQANSVWSDKNCLWVVSFYTEQYSTKWAIISFSVWCLILSCFVAMLFRKYMEIMCLSILSFLQSLIFYW